MAVHQIDVAQAQWAASAGELVPDTGSGRRVSTGSRDPNIAILGIVVSISISVVLWGVIAAMVMALV